MLQSNHLVVLCCSKLHYYITPLQTAFEICSRSQFACFDLSDCQTVIWCDENVKQHVSIVSYFYIYIPVCTSHRAFFECTCLRLTYTGIARN